MQTTTRRTFLTNSATAAAAAGLATSAQALADDAAANKVVLGVMGAQRGAALASGFAALPGVEVKYVCDIDSQRAASCAKKVDQIAGKAPAAIGDFRRILDDQDVDALVCAAPNHWHAPATIMGCNAGKHVYVEKPCSHNPWEGETMVRAARKNNKAVQLGTQRRSYDHMQQSIQALHDGAIGRVYLVRSWYNNRRGSIGTGKPAAVPKHIDFQLWQGPAPRVDYIDNLVHYNWHWRWHWGNGELGNNGVHTLDLCRWGLNVDYPTRVTSGGGRYHFQDDQETPDTHVVSFEFGDQAQITWEGLSCNRHKSGFVTFYGTEGTMEVDAGGGHRMYDGNDKLKSELASKGSSDRTHLLNFVTAIREDKPLELNAEIEKGHKSTLLCHLGNIAHRTGRSLRCNPTNGHILDDTEAMKLWKRDYEAGWEPQV